jgi:hypothetical protein
MTTSARKWVLRSGCDPPVLVSAFLKSERASGTLRDSKGSNDSSFPATTRLTPNDPWRYRRACVHWRGRVALALGRCMLERSAHPRGATAHVSAEANIAPGVLVWPVDLIGELTSGLEIATKQTEQEGRA